MIPYTPPVNDMRFVLENAADLAAIASLPGYEAATPDTVAAVLDQAADLARDVLAPMNDSGDREGTRLDNGIVWLHLGLGQGIEVADDGEPRCVLTERSDGCLELGLEHQREKTAEHMSADGLIVFMKDQPSGQQMLGGAEGLLDGPQLLVAQQSPAKGA